jgi:hypothetical protein
MYTAEFTEDEFCSLGIMATYVVDEVFLELLCGEPGVPQSSATRAARGTTSHPLKQPPHTPHLTFSDNSCLLTSNEK